MKSTSYLEGPTEPGCHLWEVLDVNFVLVSRRNWRNCCLIEQWIENALVCQGRAEGWAIISRGEALAECRGLTHLSTCFSWVSHLAVTNINGSSSQASEQVCWEPELCADLSLCMWFGWKYQSSCLLLLLCSVVLLTSILLQNIRVLWKLTQQFPGHEAVKNYPQPSKGDS